MKVKYICYTTSSDLGRFQHVEKISLCQRLYCSLSFAVCRSSIFDLDVEQCLLLVNGVK